MRAALVLLFALVSVGCVTPESFGALACPEPTLTLLAGPRGDGGLVARAPGEPTPLLFWATNPHAFNATLWATTLPTPEGAVDPADPARRPDSGGLAYAAGPGGLAFGGFREPASERTTLPFQVDLAPDRTDPAAPDCNRTGIAFDTLPLAPPAERPLAAEGQGVLVRTGGFWTNGTSFYTNHGGVHENADIPKGYLGEYGGDDPLRVYVYAEGETTPPKRYQDAGFGMTVRGFNDALKGFPAGTARLAVLAPEEAYTRASAEAHPLYGEALVFWIEVGEVVDLPCPLPAPACDLPGVPRAPVPPLPPIPEVGPTFTVLSIE